MLKQRFQQNLSEAGVDEAGRGCLAGPVLAAAVILPDHYENDLIDDSKLLIKKRREELKNQIINNAIAWSVASVDNETIDEVNILNASFMAMHKAISGLKVKPGLLLIDGNRFKTYEGIPHHCIIKGDSKYQSVAAASILAKTFRDEYMEILHQKYPQYGWNRNKGYPTPEHKKAISEYGITPFHRKSFNLNEQLKLGF